MNNYSIISIDLAKNIFQICALNQYNKVVFNKKVTRKKLMTILAQCEPTIVVMEACYSAHPWGRKILKLGHQVKLIPPYQVKPFVIGNKNDHNDAIAIAEAANRPKASFVPIKTIEQQDIQSLQRIRERLMRARTATSNQLRGLLAEYDIIIPKGLAHLRKNIPIILENNENHLNAIELRFVQRLNQEIIRYEHEIIEIEQELEDLLNPREDYQRLQTIPGIGPAISTCLLASVGDAHYFKNGRQFSAWIGLTPKQHASGNKSQLGGMSKRGNQSLRRLLIHGARSIINWCESKNDKLSKWIKALQQRAHPCKVIVALANKLARIAWAVLAHKQTYQTN